MAISVVMPALELAQETGKLVAWRKKEGDRVSKGEPLLEIETDKAVVEIESPAEGILAGIKAREGSEIPVGETIAWIVLPGESAPADSATAEAATQRPREAQAVAGASDLSRASVAPAPTAALKISPKARRLAREHGIDLTRVRGSGADGEVLASDIESLIASSKEAAGVRSDHALAAPAIEPLSSAMRLMAERTTTSWTTIPHFFVVRDVDAGALNAARERLSSAIEKSHGVHLTHTDLLVFLLARTLLNHRHLNASWAAEGLRLHPEVNIAIAVAAKDAVVAAVIHNAHTASLGEIARERRDLAERARAGRLRPSDISGATFTISNLGMHRVDAFSAIIIPPQAAILAVGSISNRVVPVDAKPGIRPMMTLTLSCDHRAVSGAHAAAFLSELADAMLKPESWQAANA